MTEPDRELRADVLRRIAKDGVDQVRLVLVDVHGIPRGKLVSAERFAHTIEHGHAWALPLLAADMWQSIPPEETALMADIGYRNGVMTPDLATFRRLPWTRSAAMVLMDVRDNEGAPMPASRQVLTRAMERASRAGYDPVFGSELEFYVYKPELGDAGFDAVFTRQSWFSIDALGRTQEFIDRLWDTARLMELPLWDVCSEHGAGQFEINLQPATGRAAIDQVVMLKLAIKEIAQVMGLRATFLARPTSLWETPPSGYHLHQGLKTPDGGNPFYDPAAPDSLSTTARHYIGGHLDHAYAMTGAVAPTVTAYKRYIPGTVAPVSVAWAIDNRSAPIRVLPGKENTHLENRLGSSDANPYLLAAVNVLAGLDGIAKASEPPPPASGNLFADDRYPRLPSTLIEGVEAFLGDECLVEGVGRDFARIYTQVLRQDWKRYIEHVSDWEIREYRELL